MKRKLIIFGSMISFITILISVIVLSQVHFKHEYSEWQVVDDITCEKNGLEVRSCECGATEERILHTCGHDYDLYDDSETDNIVYKCNVCDSEIINKKADLSYEGESIIELNDVELDTFFIDFKSSNNDEQYIRKNIKIIDMALYNTEFEDDNLIEEYTICPIGNDIWRLTINSSFVLERGTIYYVSSFNDVDIMLGDNNIGKRMNFSTPDYEHAIIEYNPDIIYLPTAILVDESDIKELTKVYEDSEQMDDYIIVPFDTVEGIDYNQILCIGNALNCNEINQDCFIGKVYDIDFRTNEIIFISPTLDEIYLEFDINTSQSINFDDYFKTGTVSDNLENQYRQVLYADEDFNKFVKASYLTAAEYAQMNALEIENQAEFTVNVGKYLKVSLGIETNGTEATLTGKGELEIELENGNHKVIFTVSFINKIKFGIDIDVDFQLKKFWNIPYGIEYLDFKITNKKSFSFDFDVNFKYEYEKEFEEPFYIADSLTKELHKFDCFFAFTTTAQKIQSSELSTYEKAGYIKCKTCKCGDDDSENVYAVDGSNCLHIVGCQKITSDKDLVYMGRDVLENYKSSSMYHVCSKCKCGDAYVLDVKSNLLHADGCSEIDKSHDCKYLGTSEMQAHKKGGSAVCGVCHCNTYNIKAALSANYEYSNDDWSLSISKSVGFESEGKAIDTTLALGSIPFSIYCISISIDIGLAFNFTFEADFNLHYENSKIDYLGIRYEGGSIKSYTPDEPPRSEQEFSVSIVGEISTKVGLRLEATLSVVGLNKFVNVGLFLEAGIYVEMIGIAEGSTTHENFAALYAEAGFYIEAGLTAKFFWLKGEIGLAFKNPVLKLGHEKVYYKLADDYIKHKFTNGILYENLNLKNFMTTIYADGLDLGSSSASNLSRFQNEKIDVSEMENLNIVYEFADSQVKVVNDILVIDSEEDNIKTMLTIRFEDTSSWYDVNKNYSKFVFKPVVVEVEVKNLITYDVDIVTSTGVQLMSSKIAKNTAVNLTINNRIIDGVTNVHSGWYNEKTNEYISLEEGEKLLSAVTSDISLVALFSPLENENMTVYTDKTRVFIENTKNDATYTFKVKNTSNENQLFTIYTVSDIDTYLQFNVLGEHSYSVEENFYNDTESDINSGYDDLDASGEIFLFKGEEAIVSVGSAKGHYLLCINTEKDERLVYQHAIIKDGYGSEYKYYGIQYGNSCLFTRFGMKIIDGVMHYQNGWINVKTNETYTMEEGKSILDCVTTNLELKANFERVDNWNPVDIDNENLKIASIGDTYNKAVDSEVTVTNLINNANFYIYFDVEICIPDDTGSFDYDYTTVRLDYINTDVDDLIIHGYNYGQVKIVPKNTHTLIVQYIPNSSYSYEEGVSLNVYIDLLIKQNLMIESIFIPIQLN